MPERRASVRVPVSLRTSFEVKERVSSTQTGTTLDLSSGGIRLSQSRPLEPGREVSISFELPTAGHVTGRGIVVWCGETQEGGEGYQSGIRWVEVHPTAQARLNAFLADWVPTPQPFRSSSAPATPIRWGRVLLAAAFVSAVLASVGYLWLDRIRLSKEAESLRSQARSTDGLVQNFLESTLHSK